MNWSTPWVLLGFSVMGAARNFPTPLRAGVGECSGGHNFGRVWLRLEIGLEEQITNLDVPCGETIQKSHPGGKEKKVNEVEEVGNKLCFFHGVNCCVVSMVLALTQPLALFGWSITVVVPEKEQLMKRN